MIDLLIRGVIVSTEPNGMPFCWIEVTLSHSKDRRVLDTCNLKIDIYVYCIRLGVGMHMYAVGIFFFKDVRFVSNPHIVLDGTMI